MSISAALNALKRLDLVESGDVEEFIPANVKSAWASKCLDLDAEGAAIRLARRVTQRLSGPSYIAIYPQRRLLIWFLRNGRVRIHEFILSLYFYT